MTAEELIFQRLERRSLRLPVPRVLNGPQPKFGKEVHKAVTFLLSGKCFISVILDQAVTKALTSSSKFSGSCGEEREDV